MADLFRAEARAVLDLCEPPDGYVFRRGIWVAHDVNWGEVADRVAPVLQGIDESDHRRRRLRARISNGADLVVLGAADRYTPGPALPWANFVPVGDRRLHAKFGVLQFRARSGKKHLTRAFVTSANLTSGGLGARRELLIWDEAQRSTTAHLTVDLLDAARDLSKQLDAESVNLVRRAVLAIRREGFSKAKRTGRITHSLVTAKDLTTSLRSEPVDRLVVISPGYASAKDRVAVPGLDDVLKDRPSVTLITARGEPGKSPVFSPAAISRLRKNAEALEIHLAQDDEAVDGVSVPRPLHAKLLAVSGASNRATLLVGSANYSSTGLLGKNRELMVRLEVPATDLDALCSSLPTVLATDELEAPSGQVPSAHVDMGPAITARFEIGVDASPAALWWRGELTIEWIGRKPRAITHCGQPVPVKKDQSFRLNQDNPVLEVVTSSGSLCALQVEVETLDSTFWERIGSTDAQDDGGDDPLLRLLFRDLHRTGFASAGAGDNGTARPKVGDKYTIPLEQRLVLLARARHRLDDMNSSEFIKKAVKAYLKAEGTEAVDTALAVLSPYGPEFGRPSDKLLRLLASNIGRLDRAVET